MSKPTIILATNNGVGMGHLAWASAVALALKEFTPCYRRRREVIANAAYDKEMTGSNK